MNVLVTGGAGYIGGVTVDALVSAGARVSVIDSLCTGHRAAVSPSAAFYEGDYGDRELLRRVFGGHQIQQVMHFAAETTVEKSMTHPREYFQTNVVKGLTLLDTMLEYGCRQIVFSSTAAVFGEPVSVPIDEDHPTRPVNAYGTSKLMFEHVLEWYQRAYGLAFAALRYFNAAGATERLGERHRPESHLLPILIEAAAGGRSAVQLYGNDYPTPDGTCIRDYVHVLDLADAHIAALERLGDQPAGKYNLGAGRGASNLEVLRMVESVSGKRIEFQFAPRRPGDPAVLVASSARAQGNLGWKPIRSSLENIVQTAWAWHTRHPTGYADS